MFLPGEFCGLRSLADYSPWGHKELDRTDCNFSHQKRNRGSLKRLSKLGKMFTSCENYEGKREVLPQDRQIQKGKEIPPNSTN